MKVLSFIAVALFAFTACKEESGSSIGQTTTIEVEPMVFDAGDVAKGRLINAEFKITNTGDYPLVLGTVSGSCSCTVTDFDKEPITPGESTTISAEVNTEKTGTGAINKSITVIANSEVAQTVLQVKANVLK